MMPWALVFAADIAAGVTLEAKNLRRKEMLGGGLRAQCVGLEGAAFGGVQ